MALTLLAMAQAAADEISFTRPASLFSNPDTTARQMLALANREGAEQSSLGEWPQLRREYTFSTVVGVDNYAMPADFSRVLAATEWDRGARWPLNGPLTPQEWQVMKSGFGNLGPRRRFRFMQGRLYLDPVPDNVTTISYEYMSTGWALAADGATFRSPWAADSDTFALDDQVFTDGIKWRFLAAKGMEYGAERADWKAALDRAFGRAASNRTLSMGQPNSSFRLLSAANIPDTFPAS